MPESAILAVFLAGLLGGTHCFGMCGGIVAALSAGIAPGSRRWPLHLAYNLGRIASYTLAGAIAGVAGSAFLFSGSLAPRLGLMIVANLMLVAMGAYLLGLPQLILPLEKVGSRLWARIQPLSRRLLPIRSPAQAVGLGLVWGWLPCGLVYSALATALASGSVLGGAATMLAFGAGTLPNLLLAGLLAQQVRALMQARQVRAGAGLVVVGLGLYGLLGVWRIAHAIH